MRNEKIKRITLLSILIALIVVFSFTPIGYIKTLGLEITLLVVPVVVGAILLGPGAGAILGFTFGLTSLLQCIFGMSQFGAMLLGINAFYTVLMCIVPRTLMGFLVGVIFKGCLKIFKKDIFAHIIACVSGALLNTILFMTALCLFFYNEPEIQTIANDLGTNNVLMFVIMFVGINGLVEAVVNLIIGACVSKTLYIVSKHGRVEEGE